MKLACKSHIATLAIAFFTTTLLNLALWRFVWQHTTVESALDAAFLISLPIFIFSIFTLLYSLLTALCCQSHYSHIAGDCGSNQLRHV